MKSPPYRFAIRTGHPNPNSRSVVWYRGEETSTMDMTWVTDRIAVGGGIWVAEKMQELVRAGVTHIIDMQIEFDDTALAKPAS